MKKRSERTIERMKEQNRKKKYDQRLDHCQNTISCEHHAENLRDRFCIVLCDVRARISNLGENPTAVDQT